MASGEQIDDTGQLAGPGFPGPFLFCLYLALADFAARNDEYVRILFRPACLLAFAGGLAPHGFRSPVSPALTSFASAVRMVHWVHRGAAPGRADPLPACATGFAPVLATMLFVRPLAYRCPRGAEPTAHFGRREFQVRVSRILGDHLRVVARRAREPSTCTGFELYIVDERTDRDVAEWKPVGCFDRSRVGDDERVTHLDRARDYDVAFLTVAIDGESDERAAEWIILDRADTRRKIFLVEAEIHHTVALFVPAALMAHRDATLGVPAPLRAPSFHETLRRFVAGEKLFVLDARHAALPWGSWFVDLHTIEWLWSLLSSGIRTLCGRPA